MKTIPYCKADDSGRIIECGELSPHTFLYRIDPGYRYAPEGVSPDTHYMKDGVPVERPTMQLAQSGRHIDGLPKPCVVTINSKSYTVPDGAVDLDLPQPGTYRVTLSAWPYRDTNLEVTIANNTP